MDSLVGNVDSEYTLLSRPTSSSLHRYQSRTAPTPTPTAGVLLGSGERAEGYLRRGIFYLEKSGCVPARVDVAQRWRP
eukprot:scaffold46864_cov31-Attheya_sp.AAC.1